MLDLLSAFLALLFPGVGQLNRGQLLPAVLVSVVFSQTFWKWLLPFMPASHATMTLLLGYQMVGRLLLAYDAAIAVPSPRRNRVTLQWAAIVGALLLVQTTPFVEEHRIARSFYVPSSSMMPTIAVNDYIAVDCRNHVPQRHEVVVFNQEKRTLIKRVVGIAGDRVSVLKGQLLINGIPEEPGFGTIDGDFAETIVPHGRFFVMGDNRNNSSDSRLYGPIPLSDYVGRVSWITWSDDWSRVGRPL